MNEQPQQPPSMDGTGGTMEFWRATAQAQTQLAQRLAEWIWSAKTFLEELTDSDLSSQPRQAEDFKARAGWLWAALPTQDLPELQKVKETPDAP
jgi:hypothetical protein